MEHYLHAGGLLVLLVVIGLVFYLLREQRRIGAALLLPKRGVPKEQIADAVAKRAIAAALAELHEYEQGHVERQAERLRKQARYGAVGFRPQRPHGSYDPDQRREFVRIRVARAYAMAGQKPPAQLEQMIRAEVPDA